ncbi:hypothetical protein [Nocardioides sp. SYSU DS0663]|uniref:hypothetical protein n=1 Tax=Nocardioides sp. SYSU DS0663 TaxID=3416445 RepID=UPI003F4C0361
MHAFQRAAGTVAATALVTSGLVTSAVAAEPTAPAARTAAATTSTGTAAQQDLLGLLPLPTLPPSLSGTAGVGQLLTLVDPVWGLLDPLLGPLLKPLVSVDTWLCNGVPIPGTAGLQEYVPTELQAGCEVTAKVVASLLGFLPLSLETSPVTVPADGDAAGQLKAVFHSALQQLTDRLGILRPTWLLDGQAQTAVQQAVQWFREKAGTTLPIPGATGWDYVPTADDAGSQVFARITGSLAGLPVVSLLTSKMPIPAQEIKATTPVAIDASKGLAPGDVLSAKAPVWDPADVEPTTYAWMVAGTPAGTGPTYTIKPGDVGKAVTVVATATKGTAEGTSTSAAITPVADELTAVTAPAISPSSGVEYGDTLSVRPATWSEGPAPTLSYRWVRNGSETVGTGSTYRVGFGDLASQLAVVVTATRDADSAMATSAPVTVAKLAAKVKAKAQRTTLRQGQKAVLRVWTKADGHFVPGRVRVFDGSKRLRTVTFEQGDKAKKVRIKMRKAGQHKLRVVYLENQYVEGSVKTVKVKVKRAKR